MIVGVLDQRAVVVVGDRLSVAATARTGHEGQERGTGDDGRASRDVRVLFLLWCVRVRSLGQVRGSVHTRIRLLWGWGPRGDGGRTRGAEVAAVVWARPGARAGSGTPAREHESVLSLGIDGTCAALSISRWLVLPCFPRVYERASFRASYHHQLPPYHEAENLDSLVGRLSDIETFYVALSPLVGEVRSFESPAVTSIGDDSST